ncbi:hypothetical protein SRABI98_00710 [Microbacterium sp. Bi98]|nr:hypothetical protein SRABI98_00710 [Microbacterium sp. Bi98]
MNEGSGCFRELHTLGAAAPGAAPPSAGLVARVHQDEASVLEANTTSMAVTNSVDVEPAARGAAPGY